MMYIISWFLESLLKIKETNQLYYLRIEKKKRITKKEIKKGINRTNKIKRVMKLLLWVESGQFRRTSEIRWFKLESCKECLRYWRYICQFSATASFTTT